MTRVLVFYVFSGTGMQPPIEVAHGATKCGKRLRDTSRRCLGRAVRYGHSAAAYLNTPNVELRGDQDDAKRRFGRPA